MSDQDPFLSFGLRDTFIHSILIECLLCGIYTLLFFYTMGMMLNNPKYVKNHKWLIAGLVTLYIFTMVHLIVQWVFTRQIYVLNGDTADDILNAIFDESLPMAMISVTMNTAATILADYILVWRCYVIWGSNWWAIALPALTLVAEVGTGIYNLVQQAQPVTADSVTADPATIYLALSLVTTVLTTVLIVFRIVRLGHFSSTSPYKNIIEIICESALLYSIALCIFLPLYVQTDLHLNFMSEYLKRIVIVMTGIAPTLIVARVAMGVARTKESWSNAGASTFLNSDKTKFSSAPAITKEIEISKFTNYSTQSNHGSGAV